MVNPDKYAPSVTLFLLLIGLASPPASGAVVRDHVTGQAVCEVNPREPNEFCRLDDADDPIAYGTAGDAFVFTIDFNERGIQLASDLITSIHLRLRKFPMDTEHRPVFVDEMRMVLTGKNGEFLSEPVYFSPFVGGCSASNSCGAGMWKPTPEFDGLVPYGARFTIVTRGDPSIGFSLSMDETFLLGGGLGTRYPSQLIFHTDAGFVADGPRVACPGDVSGDGITDIVAVSSYGGYGSVWVKGLDNRRVTYFEIDDLYTLVDIATIADTNSNGAPELVTLDLPSRIAETHDLLTGRQLAVTRFGRTPALMDIELLPDQTGNESVELASLGRGNNAATIVQVEDGLNDQPLYRVRFDNQLSPRDLNILPALNGNNVPELAVLGENRTKSKSDKLEFRHLESGEKLRELRLGMGWQVLQHAWLTDYSGNGAAEVAVLRIKDDEDAVNVLLRDTLTDQHLGSIGFDRNYPPQHLLTLGDVNGNGADEIVVFGQHRSRDNQKAQIKDSKTRQLIRRVFFDANTRAQDLATCPDINGNGSEELVLLGRTPFGSQLRAIVKDGRTGELLGRVTFD